jgi:metal-sulfur cluster biosynthetic enzyme
MWRSCTHSRSRPSRTVKDGYVSIEQAAEARQRWPQRFIGAYACVDPLRGDEAFKDLEHQAELLNSMGLKLHPTSWSGDKPVSWRMDEVQDPCSVARGTPMSLTEMGLVGSVRISSTGDVEIALRLTSLFCHMIGFMKTEAIAKVGALEGVRSVAGDGHTGLNWSPELITPEVRRRRSERLEQRLKDAEA